MLSPDLWSGRFKSIVEPYENGNYKKALQESNKLIKKTACFTAKAIKALILAKLQRFSEAYPLIEEVYSSCPTDAATISVVLSYYREVNLADRIADYLKNAIEKNPEREDLYKLLFFNHVRNRDFGAQQSTARRLCQQFPTRAYTCWTIVSTVMQAEEDPEMGRRMYLPVAEKMLTRDADNSKLLRHAELKLLVEILSISKKEDVALKYLNCTELTNHLDELDYSCDYSADRIHLTAALHDWVSLFDLCERKLKETPNDWIPWKELLTLAFEDGADINRKLRISQLTALIYRVIEEHPKVRGPQLARLDLTANLVHRGLDAPSTAVIISHLKHYIDLFGTSSICAMDLAYLIPMLLPNEIERNQLLRSLVGDVKEHRFGLTKLQSEGSVDLAHIRSHVCICQLARASNCSFSMESLIDAYFCYAPDRTELKPITNNDKMITPLDLCPTDGLLLLVASQLIESSSPPWLHPNMRTLAFALLASYWINDLGIPHATTNHHLRLRMCQLFACTSLGCPELSLAHFKCLQMNGLLLVSHGNLVVSPGLLLCIWATHQSVTGSPAIDTSNTILDSLQQICKLSRKVLMEAEECLASAYNSEAYHKITEFTRFSKHLRYADIFLLARLESLFWKTIILPDSMDALLENFQEDIKESNLVLDRLERVVDCRNFDAFCNFDPLVPTRPTQLQTFTYLVFWLRVRVVSVTIVHCCCTLAMGCVTLADNPSQPKFTDQRGLMAIERLVSHLACLPVFANRVEALSETVLSHPNELLVSMFLPPEGLFTAPPQLPSTQLISLYIHGPCRSILEAGSSLILGMYRALADVPDHLSTDAWLKSLNVLSNPFARIGSATAGDLSSDTNESLAYVARLPRPSNARGFLLSEEACHPGAILLLFGVLCESFALSCLFISMASSALRPRSHYHRQSGKRQKRKASKAHKRSSDTGSSVASPPKDINDTTVNDSLDIVGSSLMPVIARMRDLGEKFSDIIESWLSWCKSKCSKEFINLASKLSQSVLEPDFLERYPILTPTTSVQLYTEIASSYETGFDRVGGVMRQKLSMLARIQEEVQVFECVRAMSVCQLDKDDAAR